MTAERTLVAILLTALAGAPALAVDAPLTGKKLLVKDTSSPRMVLLSRDAVPGPTLTGADDPTFFGATLLITGGSGDVASFDLPAAGWTSNGTVFRFRNSSAPAGISPVKSVTITPGRRLKLVARAPGITLDEASQGSIGLVLESGVLRYCLSFGGSIVKDEPGAFLAKNASAPAMCPPKPTTTTSSTSSTTSTSSPIPTTTSSSTSSTSTSSTTSTSGTATTTSSSTTSSTTLVAGCPPPASPVGSIEFTIAPGTPNCGGPAFSPPSPGPFTGTLLDGSAATIASLGQGCLYTGGGLSNSLPPARLPDGAVALLNVANAMGLSLTLASSDGNGPADCTRGAGPASSCANGAPGTNGMGLCTTDADCGGVPVTCLPDANCFFGPPIGLPAPIPATSSCVVNVIGTDACGAADLASGASSLSVALMARLYLTSNQTEPCPRCVAGVCTAGERAGLACSGGIGSAQTTNECPPADTQFVGQLLVNPLQLSTGTATMTDPGGLFCPDQATLGAFGLANARTITQIGSPLLGGPTLFSSTLAGLFCVPASGSALVDNAEDLPGPGGVSVPGSVAVCLGVLCL